ncbi:Tyrosinase [Arthrobotrys entomopaga]|nr:Tyrosinase [Arthrobotrys entomopaga]
MNINGFSRTGTYALAPQTVENLDTPLPPFRQSNTAYHTSRSAARTIPFGYAYPETLDSEMGRASSVDVMAKVNTLYGFRVPSGVLMEALSGGSKARRTPQTQHDNKLNDPPSAVSLAPIKNNIVNQASEKYNEWTANIEVNNGALNGSFAIHLFMGDVSSTDPAVLPTEKNYVGSHGVIAVSSASEAHNGIVSGTIPLTSALLNKILSKDVENLSPEAVIPYLLKTLKVKVSVGADLVEAKDVKDLKIQIATSLVTLPKTLQDAPQWGDFKTKLNFIDVDAGVLAPVAVTN